MSKGIIFSIILIIFQAVFAVPSPCNYIYHQGYSCNRIEPSIQYYYHIASKTCQPFMYLGCGGNNNRFPTRVGCMQICQPGSIKIGQGTSPGGNPGIGQGTSPGGNNAPGIGQGTGPGYGNGNGNSGIGQGTRPDGSGYPGIGQGTGYGNGNGNGNPGIGQGVGIGNGVNLFMRNNVIGTGYGNGNGNGNPGIGQGVGIGNGVNLFMRNNVIGTGVETSSMPSIGQGTNKSESSIGDGTSLNNGIGHGTNLRLTNLNTIQRNNNNNPTIDIFNPFHPGPVKTENGSWPAPSAPKSQLSIKTEGFINGYAQMCDTAFGVNIKIPTSCGASDSCPPGFQCAGRFCCPTKKTACTQKSDSGHEFDGQESHVGRYAFQPELNNCLRFSYFGAEGNFNNFKTYNDCMRFCAMSTTS